MLTSAKYLVFGAATVFSVAACGEDSPYCGDKNLDMGEECDDGNSDDTDVCLSTCKARQLSQLTITWQFNKDGADGFTSDSCIDMGASTVEVELLGGPEPLMLSGRCSFYQAVFVDIPAEDYQLWVKVLDSEGRMLTSSIVEQALPFDGGIDSVEVVIPHDAWSGTHDGTFNFRLAWAGGDCTVANPAVAEQRLTLVAGGQTFTGTTTDGATLDGSSASSCVSLDDEFPQKALTVPFGPATFMVEGLSSEGATVYESVYETFVGAGLNNPELVFDVEAVPPPA
ncbi:MAG: hypothetical protein GY811_00255 [Myxococcales bacterium]|nr:hypothetical protein [Myxococcales bacterium]